METFFSFSDNTKKYTCALNVGYW